MLRKCGCAHIHTYWLKRKISSVLKASFCIWIPLQETVSVTIALPRELIYGPPVAVKVWDAALISRQLAGHATSRRCIPFARSTSRNAWLSITQRRSRIRGHIEILDSVLQSVIDDRFIMTIIDDLAWSNCYSFVVLFTRSESQKGRKTFNLIVLAIA